MTCWNCGGIGHSSRDCTSEDTDLAFRPADSDNADHGSKSPPKNRSGDDKDPDDKKTPKKTSPDRRRLRRYPSRGRHAHVADGDQSTSNSDSEGEEHNFLSLALDEDNLQPMRFATPTRGKSVSFALPPDPLANTAFFGQISAADECTIEDGEVFQAALQTEWI
jgi:hypothetical protein